MMISRIVTSTFLAPPSPRRNYSEIWHTFASTSHQQLALVEKEEQDLMWRRYL
jgi:hypothetical protein